MSRTINNWSKLGTIDDTLRFWVETKQFISLTNIDHFQGNLVIVVEMEFAGIASNPPTLTTPPSGFLTCKKLFSQGLLHAHISTL